MSRRLLAGPALLALGAILCCDGRADEPDEALIAKLDATTLQEREAATDAVVADARVSTADIVTLLARESGKLSPEQVQRLIAAGEAMFVDRAAVIGIQRGSEPAGIRIDKLYEAPAATVLREGDVITKFAGIGLSDAETRVNGEENAGQENGPGRMGQANDPQARALALVMEKLRPGQSVEAEVLRDGEVIVVQVPLTAPTRIPGFGLTNTQQRNRSLQWRREVQAVLAPAVALRADEDSLAAFRAYQEERARNVSSTEIASQRMRLEENLKKVQAAIEDVAMRQAEALARGNDAINRDLGAARQRLRSEAARIQAQLRELPALTQGSGPEIQTDK